MNKLYNDKRGSYACNNATRECSALVRVPQLDEIPYTIMQYITVSKSHLLGHGCTNLGYQDVQLTQVVWWHLIFVGPLMELAICDPSGA